MKYKHIKSAVHNFGHSFTSLMNYVDDAFVFDELKAIHANGHDIEVDWLTGGFKPEMLASPRIKKSVGYWRDSLPKHLERHAVEPSSLTRLLFVWPARERIRMVADDDRGKSYLIFVE